MPGPTPPPGLPPGLRTVWEALHLADREASSRQELARRLGVSTHTIQKLLVSGDLPDLGPGGSLRQRRAWARSLVRLAWHLGGDERRWIEGAGIPWDAGVATAAAEVRAALAGGPPGRPGLPPAADPVDRSARLLARMDADGDVRVGVVLRSPFSDRGEGDAPSFLAGLARRIAGAIDPRWTARTRDIDEDEPRGSVRRDLDLVIGGLAGPGSSRPGPPPLALPGLRLALAALVLDDPDRGPSIPDWDGVIVPGGPGDPPASTLLVGAGGAAEAYLRGLGGIPPGRLVGLPGERPTALAAAFRAAVRARAPRSVVLVADECTIAAVADALDADADPRWIPRRLSGTGPRIPLAIAFPPGTDRWRDLVARTIAEQLLASDATETARAYGDLLARAASLGPHASWRLEPFAGADLGFRDALVERLLGRLEATLSRREALIRASAVLPEAWTGQLADAALGPGPASPELAELLAGVPHHCESCGTPLRGARGASDRYCRWCSDERGALRPREEVHRILADWFRSWKPDLSRTEATSRAARLMDAMPAWSAN